MNCYLLFFYTLLNITLLSGQTSEISTSSSSSRVSYFSNNNYTYSESETSNDYVFSCSFEKKHLKDIEMLITQEYPGFKNSIHSKNESLEIKIRLKKNKVKLKFKTFNGQIPEDLIKIKSIASKIKQLQK
jgi:hypothetical protein